MNLALFPLNLCPLCRQLIQAADLQYRYLSWGLRPLPKRYILCWECTISMRIRLGVVTVATFPLAFEGRFNLLIREFLGSTYRSLHGEQQLQQSLKREDQKQQIIDGLNSQLIAFKNAVRAMKVYGETAKKKLLDCVEALEHSKYKICERDQLLREYEYNKHNLENRIRQLQCSISDLTYNHPELTFVADLSERLFNSQIEVQKLSIRLRNSQNETEALTADLQTVTRSEGALRMENLAIRGQLVRCQGMLQGAEQHVSDLTIKNEELVAKIQKYDQMKES